MGERKGNKGYSVGRFNLVGVELELCCCVAYYEKRQGGELVSTGGQKETKGSFVVEWRLKNQGRRAEAQTHHPILLITKR